MESALLRVSLAGVMQYVQIFWKRRHPMDCAVEPGKGDIIAFMLRTCSSAPSRLLLTFNGTCKLGDGKMRLNHAKTQAAVRIHSGRAILAHVIASIP